MYKSRILLLSIPLYGFGDFIYTVKLLKYLNEWYPDILFEIGTNEFQKYKKLIKDASLIKIKTKYSVDYIVLDKNGKYKSYDSVFIMPYTQNETKIYKTVIKKLFKTNYIFDFNAYNSGYKRDINPGIGKGFDGVFFSDPEPISKRKSNLIKDKYNLDKFVIVWAAANYDSTNNWVKCIDGFISNIVQKKYTSKFKSVQVMVPSEYYNLRKGYFQGIELLDLYPIEFQDMQVLIKESLPEILTTGDQSIVDVVNCCNKTKYIYYQIVPWRRSFAKRFYELPHLRNSNTSCNSFHKIHISDKFKRDNDFRIKGKIKIDKIISSIYISS